MLFNSYEFIFIFLPLGLAGFYALGKWSRTWALRWLILVSLFFYAWWRPLNVLLISPSILINYVLARTLQRLNNNPQRTVTSALVLAAGIAFNVAFLGYFKYTNFFLGGMNDLFGTNFVLYQVILPLGISFITFQKIAFLIDVHGNRIDSFTLEDYCLFVLFFPQLIAGPIVHYREMMPQFRKANCRLDIENVSVGLTLFFFGLFKKVCLADGIAPLVSLIYDGASAGKVISLFPAWLAAVGFTLQIYFDFSGYSDMALGLARFFGVRLPVNFNSPLRSTSIIEFWLRWHVSLTRFLTAYIYNPLVLALTRRRLKQGQPAFAGRNTTIGAFTSLLVFPTLLTMLVSGLWHGAGYLFIVWGLLHGIYLCINHAWRTFGPKFEDGTLSMKLMNASGFVLTLVAVAVAMVFFRSATITDSVHILSGMVGLNGIHLPSAVFDRLGPLAAFGVLGRESLLGAQEFFILTSWVSLLLFIALALPNTLQILSLYEPGLGVRPSSGSTIPRMSVTQWIASPVWAVGLAIIAATAILQLAGPSVFLYWQF